MSQGAEQKVIVGSRATSAPEFLDLRGRKHGGHHLAALNAETISIEAAGCRKSAKVHGAMNKKPHRAKQSGDRQSERKNVGLLQ